HVNYFALDRPFGARRPSVGGDGERSAVATGDESGARGPALPRCGHAVRLAPDARKPQALHLALGPLLCASSVGSARESASDPVAERGDVLQLLTVREDFAYQARSGGAFGRRLRARRRKKEQE